MCFFALIRISLVKIRISNMQVTYDPGMRIRMGRKRSQTDPDLLHLDFVLFGVCDCTLRIVKDRDENRRNAIV